MAKSQKAQGKKRAARKQAGEQKDVRFELYLDASRGDAYSHAETLRAIAENLFPGHYEIEMVDIGKEPQRAREAQVVATPLVILHHRGRSRRIVGDLSLIEPVIETLFGRGRPSDPVVSGDPFITQSSSMLASAMEMRRRLQERSAVLNQILDSNMLISRKPPEPETED